MEIEVQIRVSWDKPGGEALPDFRKKVLNFKNHINRLQAHGALPDEIIWKCGTVQKTEIIEAVKYGEDLYD